MWNSATERPCTDNSSLLPWSQLGKSKLTSSVRVSHWHMLYIPWDHTVTHSISEYMRMIHNTHKRVYLSFRMELIHWFIWGTCKKLPVAQVKPNIGSDQWKLPFPSRIRPDYNQRHESCWLQQYYVWCSLWSMNAVVCHCPEHCS